MTDIKSIENFLNIDVEDKKLRDGKKDPCKNRYYRYDDYYIVSLTQNRWMIIDKDKKNRKLLKLHYWSNDSGQNYARTGVNQKTKRYHQLLLNYEKGLVADHINQKKFDNRSAN